MIYGYEEPRWNDTDRKKPKNVEKNLSQYHKFHLDCSGREHGPPAF
jgi:hypothetical protein